MINNNRDDVAAENIRAIARRLLVDDPLDFVLHTDFPSGLGLNHLMPNMKAAYDLLAMLEDSDLMAMLPESRGALATRLVAEEEKLKRIAQLNADFMSNSVNLNNTNKILFEFCEWVFSVVTPVVTSSKVRGVQFEAKFQDIIDKKISVVDETLQRIDDTAQKMQTALDDAVDINERVRDLANQSVVTDHAGIFSDEAKSHNRQAYWWLSATLLSAVLAGVFTWNGLLQFVEHVTVIKGSTSEATLLPATLVRLAIASTIFWSVIQCMKQFNINRHNVVVNRHRYNSLRAAGVLMAAAQDETKSAILLQSTQAIFAPQPTGFTPDTTDASQSAVSADTLKSILTPSK